MAGGDEGQSTAATLLCSMKLVARACASEVYS